MTYRFEYTPNPDASRFVLGGDYGQHLQGNDSANNILRILCRAQDTVEDLFPSVPILEPTPLGPDGVARVVQDIPLTDTRWIIDDNNTISALLEPLLPQEPDILNRKKRELDYEDYHARSTSISDYSPLHQDELQGYFKKRRRLSIDQTSDCVEKLYRPVISPSNNNFISRRISCCTSSASEGFTHGSESKERFRAYQAEQWNERFEDLKIFQAKNGHCLIPHNFPENLALSQWVKRQRYQFKLKLEGKHSTLTDERQNMLEAMGFIWDSHKAAWEEKFSELCLFRQKYGHSNVPSKYTDKGLAIWVKCQRRQYKLHRQGAQSAMNPERIHKLESLDFVFNPRKL